MKRILLGTVIALALGAPIAALANEAYIVGDISLQSGPDSEYPPILDLQAGTPVDVQGCVEGFRWCDVIAGNDRGWVPGSYIEEEYESQPVYLIDYGPRIGVPIVSFSIGSYWDSHYHNRPFYSQRNVWVERHFEPRPPPRPSFAHAPPIPNRGGHGDDRGHAGAVGHAPPPQQHAVTSQHAVTHNEAPPKPTPHRTEQNRTEQNGQRPAVADHGGQHPPVASSTRTQTIKRTTTTEHANTPPPPRPQAAPEAKQQGARMQPKPKETPRAQPKEAPKKPPEHKDDDHGH